MDGMSATPTMSGMSGMSTMSSMSGMPSETVMPMGSSSGMMGMDMMMMVFFTSANTPLYSAAWTPANAGQYAGTCIFLIAFAALFRGLLAFRGNYLQLLYALKNRRSEGVGYIPPHCEKEELRPWRASEAVTLGAMDTLLAGVGYLLMIAVMTMNVGYFLSVLAGVFLGSMAFGRFLASSAVH